jgi:solute carrier family 10 (sodium/bile acid cotransporter), member 7
MKHGFLVLLAIAVAIGAAMPQHVGWLANVPGLRSGIVFSVLLFAGLGLRAASARSSLARPWPTIVAVIVNLVGLPVLAGVLLILAGDFFSDVQAAGLWVATIAPCTLASAAVWTRRAGGNIAVAMLTTLITNMACLVTIPISLYLSPVDLVMASGNSAIDEASRVLDPGDQFQSIALLVVLPIVLGMAMRGWFAARWADQHATLLTRCGQAGILMMVAFGSAASFRFGFAEGASSVPKIVLVTGGLHLTALAMAYFATIAGGYSRSEAIASGISASQKTLMVGLQISLDLGVSVVPMLAYHIVQLLIDTIVADYFAARNGQQALKPTASDA